MKKILVFSLICVAAPISQAQSVANAEENCTRSIKESWERTDADRYGRENQQSFVQIFPTGPYPPGKYGDYKFYVFNLALNKRGNIIEFAVDCVFDSKGKVVGLEVKR